MIDNSPNNQLLLGGMNLNLTLFSSIKASSASDTPRSPPPEVL